MHRLIVQVPRGDRMDETSLATVEYCVSTVQPAKHAHVLFRLLLYYKFQVKPNFPVPV